MKLPENLDPNLRQWDAYRAFHWGYGPAGVCATNQYGNTPFIIFETGEVVTTAQCVDVSVRCIYRALNLELVSTTDSACPALVTPDGRSIPNAWLTQSGMQYLLVDYCTKHVVAVAGTQNPAWAQVCPARFVTGRNEQTGAPTNWRIRAWIPGAGMEPTGFGLIDLSIPTPNKDWVTPEQREHIATVTAVGNAVMVLKNTPRMSSPGLPFERVIAVSEFGDLTNDEQLALFQGGVRRKLVQVDHLVLAP